MSINFGTGSGYFYVKSNTTIDNIVTLTISCWINPSARGSFVNNPTIVQKTTNTADQGWSTNLSDTTNTKSIQFLRNWTGGLARWATPANTFIVGTWGHVVFTYDNSSTANSPKIYWNGILQTLTTITTASGTVISEANSNLYFGEDGTGTPSGQFVGPISELAIWNVILNQDEVNNLALSKTKRIPLQIHPNNLLAYWSLDDYVDLAVVASGGTLYDSGKNRINMFSNNNSNSGFSEQVLTYL